MTKNYKLRISGTLILALALAIVPMLNSRVFAGALTNTSILELGGASNVNPMIVSANQAFALDFKTVGAGATTASVNFNAFTGGTVNGTQSISSTGCANYFPGSTPLTSGSTLAASGSGTTISISNISALAATTEYCTVLTSTSAVTNPGSGGVYSALVTVGSDSKTAAFDVLSLSTDNSYTINGTVSPTFTMALSGLTSGADPIATLSASALTVSTGAVTTINTNATNGWNLYAMDANAGLHSTNASHTIPSVAGGSSVDFSTPGTEQYGLGVSANATTNYTYTGSNHGGALSSSAFNSIATSGTTATNVAQTLHELVNISATTQPASDYADTITLIGAGSF
jgi:hypothetical protein